MAPAVGQPVPGLSLAAAEPEPGLPCWFRGDDGHTCSGPRASLSRRRAPPPTAGRGCSPGGRCRCPWPRGLAGPRRRCLTAFPPCPLQRRKREQRRAGTPAGRRQRARAEGETPASPRSRMEPPARRRSPWPRGWAQRDPPVPRPRQQVTRSLPRGFPGRPAPSPLHIAPTARGRPWGGQPTLPAPGHRGTG